MTKFKELERLKQEYKDATLIEYLTRHVASNDVPTPLDPESHDVFQSNFSTQVYTVCTGSHMAFLSWDDPFCLSEMVTAHLLHFVQNATTP